MIATISKLTLSDGTVIEPGVRVMHVRGKYEATVTGMTIAESGASAVRIKVKPDSLKEARKYDTHWPLTQGGEYIEARDSGLTLRHWIVL